MIRDAQGYLLSGATTEAAGRFDEGVRAFALSYGDAIGAFEAARQAEPAFAMAHLGKAWVFANANDAVLMPQARALLAAALALPLNEREQAHAAALAHAVEGHRASGTRILDRHLMRYPCDLLAHFAALLLDAFQGRFPFVRDRSARALPFWSKTQPGYGVMLSFYGFGLEEAGCYAQSEETSRAAAEIEPHGYWPHHAVSHVMEMTGRPDDGLKWMDDRTRFWSAPENMSQVHIWWHKALFHIELGQYDAALAIYDGPLLTNQRPVGLSLTNGTALLWRLETLGVAAGDRWQHLATLWDGRANGRISLFADVHAAMTALRAGRNAEVERLLTGMRATAAAGTDSSAAYRDIGLPIVHGLAAFDRGQYAQTVEHLLPARADLWRMGGSIAQRDMIDWTLTEAASRAGLRDVALSLAHERLALRPQSQPNQRFLRQAAAITE